MKTKNRKVNPTEVMIPRVYQVGDLVYGIRSPDAYVGRFVRAYVTINGPWRNAAYVIKCDVDGKERVFQSLRPFSKGKVDRCIVHQ